MLSSAAGTHNRSDGVADTKVAALASNHTLQLALLTCAVELTCYCTTGIASFPFITAKLGQLSAALDIWEAAGHFLHHLAAETTILLAESVSNYLLFMRIKVVEHLAWKNGSSLYQAMCDGGGGSKSAGDYALVCSFIDHAAALCKSRAAATAAAVARVNAVLNKTSEFVDDCLWAMHLAVYEHLDLLFNQHLSNLVACCVYGVARAHGVSLSFKKVTDTIMHIFPHHTPQDFTQAELRKWDNIDPRFGDTRQVYNEVFLPRMEQAFLTRFASKHQPMAEASELAGNKAVLEAKRGPLKTLSLADLNTRPSRLHRMQA